MSARFNIIASMLLVGVAGLHADSGSLRGQLSDPQGRPVADAKVTVCRVIGGNRSLTVAALSAQRSRDREGAVDPAISDPAETLTGSDGRYVFSSLPAGAYKITGSAPGLADVSRTVDVSDGRTVRAEIRFLRMAPRAEAVTVTADVKNLDIQNPDPAQRIVVRVNNTIPILVLPRQEVSIR